jgi:pyruvate dehydrogenase E2 component (dihydrolipoamide acetyltransferase)
MSNNVLMPKLGLTMETGLILRWLKQEGEKVARGEGLFEVESDKSTVEVESEFSGVLLKRYYGEGVEVPCTRVIAVIGEAGEPVPDLMPADEGGAEPQRTESEQPAADDAPAGGPEQSGRILASPRARRYAREHGVDLALIPGGSGHGGRIEEKDVRAAERSGVRPASSPLARKIAAREQVELAALAGSGPGGRIVKEDVLAALDGASPAPGQAVTLPVSRMRSLIAERLSAAKRDIPHYTLNLSIDMTTFLETRRFYNQRHGDPLLSVNTLLVKGVSVALGRHPLLNASWGETVITLHPRIDIAVAVATESGLLTPVVRDCSAKSAGAIETELQGLIVRAREGKLLPEDYQNPTFTISNLGSYGIEHFTAIINPPAAAILAVGRIMEKPVGLDGGIVLRPLMSATLSCDHRLVDGAVGAAFLRELKDIIEKPFLGYL